MNQNKPIQKIAQIVCKRCGAFFETELATEVCDNDPEKALFTNFRSCLCCGNRGYIEGSLVNMVNEHGVVTAFVSPMNDLFPSNEESVPLVGFSALTIQENGIEIPFYSSFCEWEVDSEDKIKAIDNDKGFQLQEVKEKQ